MIAGSGDDPTSKLVTLLAKLGLLEYELHSVSYAASLILGSQPLKPPPGAIELAVVNLNRQWLVPKVKPRRKYGGSGSN